MIDILKLSKSAFQNCPRPKIKGDMKFLKTIEHILRKVVWRSESVSEWESEWVSDKASYRSFASKHVKSSFKTWIELIIHKKCQIYKKLMMQMKINNIKIQFNLRFNISQRVQKIKQIQRWQWYPSCHLLKTHFLYYGKSFFLGNSRLNLYWINRKTI